MPVRRRAHERPIYDLGPRPPWAHPQLFPARDFGMSHLQLCRYTSNSVLLLRRAAVTAPLVDSAPPADRRDRRAGHRRHRVGCSRCCNSHALRRDRQVVGGNTWGRLTFGHRLLPGAWPNGHGWRRCCAGLAGRGSTCCQARKVDIALLSAWYGPRAI